MVHGLSLCPAAVASICEIFCSWAQQEWTGSDVILLIAGSNVLLVMYLLYEISVLLRILE